MEEHQEVSLPGTVPFDRALEQAIVSIKKGAYLLKCGSRGKPKLCPFRLSTDERNLIWCSGQQEKHLRLSGVTKIVQGQGNIKSQRQNETEKECHSFSLIYANGEHTLDLICKDKAQAATWFVGLKAMISRCQQPKAFSSLRSCKGVQSCVSSPAGILRRKKNLGLLDDTSQFTQVHSVCASPTLSLQERCFSDGMSYTSDNFYSSASSLSSTQCRTDSSVPSSPYINPAIHSNTNTSRFEKEYKKDLWSYRSIMSPTTSSHVGNSNNNVLKDVMIWGGGIGCLVGIVNERFVQNSIYSLVPKLLESTAMLDVQNIALGGNHAAIATKQGEVYCWGQGKRGRLGQKIDMDISSPKIVDSLSDIRVKNVACGEYHTCALTDSGEVYAWGNDVSCSDSVDEGRFRSQWLTHKLSLPVEGISISSVACGEWHTAIVSSCGRLFTYGDGTFGVLGHGNYHSFSSPKEVESLKGLCVRSVACGTWHTAAIIEVIADRFKYNTSTGKLFTWGDGDEARLGHADNGNKLVPTCVSQLVDYDFVQVSCGRMLTLALTNMGKVFAIGSAKYGQLGNPHVKDRAVLVEGMLKQEYVKMISCGSYHAAVLTSSGSVYTWGKGENGQLGLGDTENRYTPCFVEALRDRQVDTINCGPSFTVAVCLHKPISISDQSSCSGCRLAFGFTRKKHNCYNCGLLFCRACSSKKVTDASLAPDKSKAFRVCDSCFDRKQGSSSSTHSVLESFNSRNCYNQQIQKDKLRISMGYSPEDVIIAIVGSQFLYKGMWLGHAVVLQALSPLLADFPLSKDNTTAQLRIIVHSGELTNNYTAALETMARSLKYPKGTIELIAGDLNSESVLGTADVVIYGSLLEEQSFPEILIKAMCFEKPIIAPDISMIRKYVDDRVNGYLFPKDNIRVLRQIMLEVISKRKISPLARNIASMGRRTAKNLMVSEAIDGYATLLQNIIKLPSEVVPPKAVSEISPHVKEKWQWHLLEVVPNSTYQNRVLRSNTFLDKYEDRWNRSRKERSSTAVADSDSFVYMIWEEEKHIQMAITRKRIEDEELKDRTEQSHGTWEEVYRNAKKADRLKNDLHERDDGELERTGQPLCIYEPYFGEGSWPFLHQRSLYRGVSLSSKGKRPGKDDFDAPSRLPLLNSIYYRDVLGEFGSFFAIANRIDRLHKNAWIGFQSWRATARKASLSRAAENALLDAIQSKRNGDTLYFWARMDTDPRNPSQTDFWSFCDGINAGGCKPAFSEALRRMYGLKDDVDALPPMPVDGDTWSVMLSWALPTRSFLEFVMFSRMFIDALDAQMYEEHHLTGHCPLSLSKDKHCYSRVLELLVNVWAYHSARRMVFVNPETGLMQEQHNFKRRRGQMRIKWFSYNTLKNMDEDLAELSDSEDPNRHWLWPSTGEVFWQGLYERERSLRHKEKEKRKQKSLEKLNRMRKRHRQQVIGKYVKPPPDMEESSNSSSLLAV